MVSIKQKNVVSKLANAKKINYTPLLLLGNFGLLVIIILQLLFQGSLLLEVGNEPPTRFVELTDGRVLKTQPIASKERSPQAIDKFTRTMMLALFSVSDSTTFFQGKSLKNQAVEINDKTITEKNAIALQFVTPDLMPMLLEDISKIVDQEILAGSVTRSLRIEYLSKPEKVKNKNGYWEMEIIASIVSFDSGKRELLSSRFNKKIQVKTIDYPTEFFQASALDLNQKILNIKDKTYLKELFYELSNAGLEISLISSL